MTIRVWTDPAVDGVMIAREAYPGGYYFNDPGHPGGLRIIDIKPGEPRPVWMQLDYAEARELAAALNKELPWGDEAREALADTRHVRDRLLTIVERVTS